MRHFLQTEVGDEFLKKLIGNFAIFFKDLPENSLKANQLM
jgi:hypothetical protein